jgi:hypothetical protein
LNVDRHSDPIPIEEATGWRQQRKNKSSARIPPRALNLERQLRVGLGENCSLVMLREHEPGGTDTLK